MGWEYWVILAINVYLAYTNKPKLQNAKPAMYSDFDIPTAEEGRLFPVLFGTRRMPSPNVVWSGDFSSEAIRE
jgi:hypothetical protein